MPKEEGIVDWKFIFKINRAIGILKYIDKLDENKTKMKFILNKVSTNIELRNPLMKMENSIQKIENIKVKSENDIKNIKEEVIQKIEKMQDNSNKIYNEFFIKMDIIKKNIDPQKYESKISTKMDILKRNIGIYKKRNINIVEETLK